MAGVCEGLTSPMPATHETLPLPDGRTLDVLLGGNPDGIPLLVHHGTPSDGSTWADWHDDCAARGLRLVAASRPGYATSTRHPGRDVAAAAADAAALLDHLGHDEFLTAGWSGGGPHALACAALLPERCRAAATLAGAAKYGEPDLDFLAGMGPENVEEFGAAVSGESSVRSWMAEHGAPLRTVTGEQVAEELGGLVPQADKDVLRGGYAEDFAATTRRALAGGFDGWVDDDLAFTRDWGVDLAAITVPVSVWQGDLDLMVPAAHGRWLVEKIPTAKERTAPGHGHLSLVTRFRAEILDELMTQGGYDTASVPPSTTP